MASLQLKNIRKVYDKHVEVIKGISLDIREGEFIVFVGPSGCGKSTMLRMIAGLEEITSGDLFIGDRRVNDVAAADRGLAMVFQSYALYPHMSVYENMAFSLKLSGMKAQEIDSLVRKAAEALKLTTYLDRRPKALSGGQRQRVAIGRAIVRKPDVFLFDEPLSNLDAALRGGMRMELARLHKELGSTMIYVTHDQVEAMTLGERIAVFNAGVIEQVGTPMELYTNPKNIFVAGFLGSPSMNLIPCEATAETSIKLPGGSVVAGLSNAAALPAGVLQFGIRPEYIKITARDTSTQAIATHVEHLGDSSIVYAQIKNLEKPLAIKCGKADLTPENGDVINLEFDLPQAIVFDEQGSAIARKNSDGK